MRLFLAGRCLLAAGALALTTISAFAADPADIARRAELAARYMASVQRADGLFVYDYDLLIGRAVNHENTVRQAGAAFGLSEYLDQARDLSLTVAVRRAVAALAARSYAYADGAVVSTGASMRQGNAGATALALLAELGYADATGDEHFAAARRRWLSGLIALQQPSGAFAQSPANPTPSSFYDGEGWLALARFAERATALPWTAAALAKADDYMLAHYAAVPDANFAHWGLLAAASRYATTHDARFLDFASGLADAFITRLRPVVLPEANGCSAVEGLVAAADTLAAGGRAQGELDARIRRRIDAELEKDLGFQILPGQRLLAIGGDRTLDDPGLTRFAGAFLDGRNVPRLRIDFTQHCLSAMLGYQATRANGAH